MRIIAAFVFIILSANAFAAPAPVFKEPEKVKRVTLPHGEVKIEVIATKGGRLIRITAGKVIVEGKTLFYGDGKLASEIRAAEKGMQFIYWGGGEGPMELGSLSSLDTGMLLGGTFTHGPTGVWYVTSDAPAADKLKPGSIYVINPSVKFQITPPRSKRPR